MAGNTVSIKVTADDQASSKLRGIKDEAEKSEGPLKRMASGLGDVAKIAGGFVVAQGLFQLGGVIRGAIGDATDMNETISKSRAVFGDSSAAIEAWASGAAKDFGQSKLQALDAAAGFGNMFDQLGVGAEESAKLSQGMVELASDFASFHNADISEVLNAQASAFRGEYDALQRFLPLINAASVEQKALEMTGKSLTSELTAQEKALAVNALMYEGAGEAMGDFDKTSGSLANQQKILKAQFADVSAEVGSVLLPGLLKVTTFLTENGPIWAAKVKEFGETVKPILQEVGAFVQEQFQKFRTYYEQDIQPALDNIKTGVEGVISFIREHWPEIEAIVRPVIEQVQNIVTTAFAIITGILNVFIQLLGGDFKSAWEATKGLIGAVRDYWVETIQNAYDLIAGILGRLFQLAKDAMAWFKDGAVEVWTNTVQPWFAALPGNIVSAIGDLVGTLSGKGKEIIGGFWTGLIDKWLEMKGWVSDLPGEILGAIGDVTSYLWQKGKDLIQGMVNGMLSVSVPNPLNLVSGGGFGLPNLPGFAKGLWEVPGPRGAGDVFPALLSPGEMVVPTAQADRLRGGGGMSAVLAPAMQVIQLVVDGQVLAEAVNRQNARGFA